MYGGLDISVSGMIAQRTLLNVIATNIANMDSVATPGGDAEPFRRKIALMTTGDPRKGEGSLGSHISAIIDDTAPFNRKYEPGHELADKDGYVLYPNIDPVTEQISAVEAVRAYEANVAAAEATKALVAQALRLIA